MADITSVLTKRGNLSKPYYIKADMMQEQRRLEIILMRERWKLIQSGVSRTHIKIRNSNIYVKNKLHGLVMGSEFKPATTMDSLLGDCEQSPYSAAKSNPIVSLNDFKSPPVGQQPNTSVATTTIVGQKEADSASHSSSLCPTAKASGPNSLTESDSSPGKYQTSSMGSTTYSPGPSSVFNSPNHAPAEQHSTN